jgi:hypothetical protein
MASSNRSFPFESCLNNLQLISVKMGLPMGGYGSGRPATYDKKRTVEDCLSLDARKMGHRGQLAMWCKDFVLWDSGEGIVFDVTPGGRYDRVISLHFTLRGVHKIECPIELQSTVPHFGGKRWWFVCPGIEGRETCDRRVAKLYFPPGAVGFACRHCHELTYRSCQDSRNRETWFDRFLENPKLIQQIAEKRRMAAL